jgi:phosphoribosylglycinamide formyltransferase-1
MIKIGFLASGNGGTLKFLDLVRKMNIYNYSIQFVIADQDCGAIEYAVNNNMSAHVVKYNKTNRQDLFNILIQYKDTDIVITNIHKVLDNNILEQFNGRLINLHYSLLPAYGGLIGMKTVDEARTDNAMFIGATCHEVSEILDGGKIICQSCFSVDWNLSDEVIKDLVFQSANLCLLNSILIRVENKNFRESSYKKVNFNPALKFMTDKFTDDFWCKIKS